MEEERNGRVRARDTKCHGDDSGARGRGRVWCLHFVH